MRNPNLDNAVNWLLLHSSFTNNLGLMNGKMGSVLFFALYFQHTQNEMYDDFAGDLLSEVIEDIHLDIPYTFENGMLGIAWGIQFLLLNGYMEGDAQDVLCEIEESIMQIDPMRITDDSLENGIMGWVAYLRVCELAGRLPFDNCYRERLDNRLSYFKNKSFDDCVSIQFVKQIALSKFLDKNIKEIGLDKLPMGLKDGYVGFALKEILA